MVNTRDRFIREAVLQQGYLASGRFFSQLPSNQYQPCAAEDLRCAASIEKTIRILSVIEVYLDPTPAIGFFTFDSVGVLAN